MRVSTLLITGLVAVAAIACTGCSEATIGVNSKSAHADIARWRADVLSDIGASSVLSHSTTVTATDSCGDWTSRYELSELKVIVPFNKLTAAAQAIIDGQSRRGWDVSKGRVNVTTTGSLTGGTIRPPHAAQSEGITFVGTPSNSEGEIDLTMSSACFVR